MNWRPERRNELPKDTQEFYGKVTETVKHMNYLSNLLFKWGCVHRSKWSAEQWKLEPDNLLTQNSAMCSHWLVFQFDFSLLVLCGAQDDPPWSQQGSQAGTTAMWRTLGCNHSLAASQAATSSASQLCLPTSPVLVFTQTEEIGSSVSAFRKEFFLFSVSWLRILDS